MINFEKYEILSFDCYGTLIDWESGILGVLRPILRRYNTNLNDKGILELYMEIEADIERGNFIVYREVLKRVIQELGNKFGVTFSSSECLVDSLKNWIPFSDTVDALQTLKKKKKKKFKLAVISNIDNDLFALSAQHLKIKFDYIITSEDVKSYKPSLRNFKIAVERMSVPPTNILHIAQSIYHDIIPAKTLGLSTIWVNRKGSIQLQGTTLQNPPDLEVPDLKTLVSIIE